MDKKYWFYIEPYVYVEFQPEGILLYNTNNGEYIETSQIELISMVKEIYEPKNLGVIMIDEAVMQNINIKRFISNIIKKTMGVILSIEKKIERPIVLLPIVSLNKDVDRLVDNNDSLIYLKKDIGKYLLELNIYINNECSVNCMHCDKYYKQVPCCTNNYSCRSLLDKDIHNIFRQIRYLPIQIINIFGGDVFKGDFVNIIKEEAKKSNKIIRFFVHYASYNSNNFVELQNLNLIVPAPFDKNELQTLFYKVSKKNMNFHFIIENENQYDDVMNTVEVLEIEKFVVHPFYNKQNLSFFEDNVFLEKEDIFSKVISMKTIFRNKKMNANFFGSIYIMPNGDIMSNLNTIIIGNIKKDKLLDVIYKELVNNLAWRKTRSLVSPCKKCVYQNICPPISNYELAMEKINFCHIK